MKELYNKLKLVFEQWGFDLAPYGENTFFNPDRTLILELKQAEVIEPLFCIFETTFTVSFVNGETWETNSAKLSDALTSCICPEDRAENMLDLPDNSTILKILEAPEFSEIGVEIDAEDAEEMSNVTVTIIWEEN